MEDPNLIATLVATEPFTERACELPHNHERYRPPSYVNKPFSRETTPFYDEDDENDESNNSDAAHRLKLTFDKPPKNAREGVTFGWGPECDILLADRENFEPGDRKKVSKVSRKHFSITFDQERRVILRDTSTHGTAVSYDGQAKDETRRHFTWIIFPGFEKIEIRIPKAGISFKIQLAEHEKCKAQFLANVDSTFFINARPEESILALQMDKFNVQSRNTSVTNSGALTPRQGPIYLLHEWLGSGEFGVVNKVIDVSTGRTLAGKSFFRSPWAREVAAMKKLKHENIVRFIDFREEPAPLLIMEYLPLGHLDKQHDASDITFQETLTILIQGLKALVYLQSQGMVHRDIKPENMLVASRTPFKVKLADLGLAKDDRDGNSLLKTWVGSYLYAAPEIWGHENYTSAVDIWSLGVVVLRFGYGLPARGEGGFNAQKWHSRVVKAVQHKDPDDLTSFLSSSMLRVQAEERHSVGECLKRAMDVESTNQRMLEMRAFRSGSATPTETSFIQTDLVSISEQRLENQRLGETSADRSASGSSDDCYTLEKRTLKRQRSADSNVSRDPRSNLCTDNLRSTYKILNLSESLSRQLSTASERVLHLLKATLNSRDNQGDGDSLVPGLVNELCVHLDRLRISEIETHYDDETEQTILLALSEANEFVLASLTSSDLANSIADFARHLVQIMRLLNHPPTSGDGMQLDTTEGVPNIRGNDSVPMQTSIESPRQCTEKSTIRSHLSCRSVMKSNEMVFMVFRRRRVAMRISSLELNASEILLITKLNKNERKRYLDIFKDRKVGVYDGKAYWVPFRDAVCLCHAVGVFDSLRPLLSWSGLPLDLQGDNYFLQKTGRTPPSLPAGFAALVFEGHTVVYKPSNRMVNARHLVNASGLPPSRLKKFLDYRKTGWTKFGGHKKIQGTYVTYTLAQELCEHLGLRSRALEDLLLGAAVTEEVTCADADRACEYSSETKRSIDRRTIEIDDHDAHELGSQNSVEGTNDYIWSSGLRALQ